MVRNRASVPGCRTAISGLILVACATGALAQGTPPPPAVTVAPVASREVTDTAEFVGRIVAINKVDIVARVPGFIEERTFTEGQEVKKGDLLFRIEQATYKALVDQQLAAVAKAKAVEANAVLQLDRGRELGRSLNIPQSTIDQRAADAGTAKADVMVAQAALSAIQSLGSKTTEKLAAGQWTARFNPRPVIESDLVALYDAAM